jgi:hypothetical protein
VDEWQPGLLGSRDRSVGAASPCHVSGVAGKETDVAANQRARAFIDTGLIKYENRVVATRSMHKDGRKVYVDLSFGLVRDDTAAITGALAVGRDCTAPCRWRGALLARVDNRPPRPRG